MNFFEVVFLLFAGLALIIAIRFFFKQKGDKVANCILGVYLLLFTFNIIFNCLYWSKLLYTKSYIHFFSTNYFPWVSYGPLFYLYIRRVSSTIKLSLKDIFHFIPFIIILLSKWRFFQLNTNEKISVLDNATLSNYNYLPTYTNWIIVLQILIYGILSLMIIKKNRAKFNYNKLLWLKIFTGAFFGYWIAFASYFVLSHFNLITTENDYAIGYVIVFFIGIVTYFGIMQPDVFNGLPIQKVIPFIKYKKTGLSIAISIELKERLIKLMKDKKPYLENDLKLSSLAESLNISRHHMSQVINEHFDLSFFDYINQYRINDAKLLLLDNEDDLNISQIAYSVGFNNRVSFYKAFKKFESITPTEYLNLNNNYRKKA